jgi:hypothetical protein
MGFHINDKKNKAAAKSKTSTQGGSKFIAKPNTKSSGATKKPIKDGGARGS